MVYVCGHYVRIEALKEDMTWATDKLTKPFNVLYELLRGPS